MSEEVKVQEVPLELQPQRESISATMLKKIRALNKNQLVDKLIAVHNYAESQKATNMVLLFQVKQLNEKLNGKPQEVAAETSSEGNANEAV